MYAVISSSHTFRCMRECVYAQSKNSLNGAHHITDYYLLFITEQTPLWQFFLKSEIASMLARL